MISSVERLHSDHGRVGGSVIITGWDGLGVKFALGASSSEGGSAFLDVMLGLHSRGETSKDPSPAARPFARACGRYVLSFHLCISAQ